MILVVLFVKLSLVGLVGVSLMLDAGVGLFWLVLPRIRPKVESRKRRLIQFMETLEFLTIYAITFLNRLIVLGGTVIYTAVAIARYKLLCLQFRLLVTAPSTDVLQMQTEIQK